MGITRSLFDACGSDVEHNPAVAVLGDIRLHLAPTSTPGGLIGRLEVTRFSDATKVFFVRLVINGVLARTICKYAPMLVTLQP